MTFASRIASLIVTLTMTAMPLHAQTINVMPMPAHVAMAQGRFYIGTRFSVEMAGYHEPRIDHAVGRFLGHLKQETDVTEPRAFTTGDPEASMRLYCAHAGEPEQSVSEDESYSLVVTQSQIRLDANTPAGVMRGLETLLQLVDKDEHGYGIPALEITDSPRYPWRGLLLDVSRHWEPVDVVERTLDGMAAVKLNVFHWHLSDDQGFRFESKVYPKLQGMGSDGHFYTQNQIKDVIAYARDRGIRVVPEFDIPGHSTSWCVGYPELASAPGPYTIERHFGVFEPTLDPTREEVYTFLDHFIGEVASVFPDHYIHIGGDEVNPKQWDANPNIQAFMKAHGIANDDALQAYFNTRLLAIAKKHGKSIIGWDEVLTPNLPKDVVVQSWRGGAALGVAAKAGHATILSNGYYLDAFKTAADHYAVDPLGVAPPDLTPAQKKLIMGGEVCMWGEYVNPVNVDSRIWPRAAAVAERLWSPANVTDVNSMYRRLAILDAHLAAYGLTQDRYQKTIFNEQLQGATCEALPIVASVLTPLTDWSIKVTSAVPLNRLKDVVKPESLEAWELSKLVENPKANAEAIRNKLVLWQNNATAVMPVMRDHPMLTEDVPVAQMLNDVCQTGLQALGYITSGEPAPASWSAAQAAFLAEAAKPHNEVVIAITPAVQVLVNDAAGTTH
jgi:hexosaminidase